MANALIIIEGKLGNAASSLSRTFSEPRIVPPEGPGFSTTSWGDLELLHFSSVCEGICVSREKASGYLTERKKNRREN